MNRVLKLAAQAAVVVALMTPSLFAESRHRSETDWRRNDDRNGRATRVEGRVRDIDRERNGFVIELSDSRIVLFTRDRSELRGLDRGDYIRAYGSLDSRGVLHVRDIDIVRNSRRDRDDRRDDRRDRRW